MAGGGQRENKREVCWGGGKRSSPPRVNFSAFCEIWFWLDFKITVVCTFGLIIKYQQMVTSHPEEKARKATKVLWGRRRRRIPNMSRLLTWLLTWVLETHINHMSNWRLDHDDARDAVEEVVDEKKNSPSANHRLLSHHVVQPLLVTKDVSPHKAGDVILINWDGTCCPDRVCQTAQYVAVLPLTQILEQTERS